MASFSKVLRSYGPETTVRLALLLNNSVALALSFACMLPLFMVVGSILGVSILFNLFALLSALRPKRLRLKTNNSPEDCPSLFVLGMDMLGVLAFLSLYVCSTIETATRSGWGWGDSPILLMAYSSIGTLVAFAMHGFLTGKNLHKYVRYRQSLGSRCPHCHQELGFVPAGIALPPSPQESAIGPAEPRQSSSANSAGENEGDMLIMKS